MNNGKESKISIGGVALAIYIVCMPLAIAKSSSGSSILKYISILVVLLYMIEIMLHKERYVLSKSKIKIDSVFFIYILVSGFGIFTAVKFNNAVNTLESLILMFGLIVVISLRDYNEKEYKLIKKCWIISALIIATMTVFFGQESGYMRTTASFLGGTEDKNQLTGYMFLPIIYLLNYILTSNKFRILNITFFVFIMYSILITGSRGGLLGILASIVVYILYNFKNANFKKKVSIILIVIFVGILAFWIIIPMLPDVLVSRMSIESAISDKGSNRLVIWSTLFELLSINITRLLGGFGLSGTVEYLHVGFAHNQFIQVLFDGGIISLGIFTVFIMMCIKKGLNTRKVETIAFIGMFILSLTITTYPFYKPYWNMILMLVIEVKGENKLIKGGEHRSV